MIDFTKHTDDELIKAIDRIDKFRNSDSYDAAMKEFHIRKEKNPNLDLLDPWWTFSWMRFSMITYGSAIVIALVWGENIRKFFGWNSQCKKSCPDFFALFVIATVINLLYYKVKSRKEDDK